MSNPKPMIITGLVIPSGWDKDGNVAGLTIAAFDEEEYFVQSCADTGRLMMMQHKEIVAEGWVTTVGKSKFMDITKFEEKPVETRPFYLSQNNPKQDVTASNDDRKVY